MAKKTQKTTARKATTKASAASARTRYEGGEKITATKANPYREGKDFHRVFEAVKGKTVTAAEAAVAKLKNLGEHATLTNVLRDAKAKGCVKVA